MNDTVVRLWSRERVIEGQKVRCATAGAFLTPRTTSGSLSKKGSCPPECIYMKRSRMIAIVVTVLVGLPLFVIFAPVHNVPQGPCTGANLPYCSATYWSPMLAFTFYKSGSQYGAEYSQWTTIGQGSRCVQNSTGAFTIQTYHAQSRYTIIWRALEWSIPVSNHWTNVTAVHPGPC